MHNLMQLASILEDITANIERLVRLHLRRVVEPPPSAHTKMWYDVFDALFDLEAEHHQRNGRTTTGGTIELVQDIHELLEMLNDDIDSDEWWHYCWGRSTRWHCCKDMEECIDKMVVRLWNVLVARAFPRVTMSTFCNVLKGLCRVIAGQAVKRLLPAVSTDPRPKAQYQRRC